MHCLYCGSTDHPWFNCRKKPEGWKPPKKSMAARKDRAEWGAGTEEGQRSGNQAPPIDTAPKPSGRPRSIKPSEGKTKRAAEMRDYMRNWRAKKAWDKRNG